MYLKIQLNIVRYKFFDVLKNKEEFLKLGLILLVVSLLR